MNQRNSASTTKRHVVGEVGSRLSPPSAATRIHSGDRKKDEEALYEVKSSCSHLAGRVPIKLDIGWPKLHEGIYIIGHPEARPQELSHQEPHKAGQDCQINKIFKPHTSLFKFNRGLVSTSLEYRCDSQVGNSGSPVISARTGYAIGIHKAGVRGGNGVCPTAFGNSLAQPNIVRALQQFGIPLYNREHQNIMLQEVFVPVQTGQCASGQQSVRVHTKTTQAGCEDMCKDSLICVAILYEDSARVCTMVLRSISDFTSCPSGTRSWKFKSRNLFRKAEPTGPTPPPTTTSCKDSFDTKQCRFWADQGFCSGKHSVWMSRFCKSSCKKCG